MAGCCEVEHYVLTIIKRIIIIIIIIIINPKCTDFASYVSSSCSKSNRHMWMTDFFKVLAGVCILEMLSLSHIYAAIRAVTIPSDSNTHQKVGH